MTTQMNEVVKKHGIMETKEMLIGIMETAMFLLKRFKDGADTKDFMAIWDKLKNDEEYKKVMSMAYEGYNKIPAEAGDIDVYEATELITCLLMYIPKMMEALKTESK